MRRAPSTETARRVVTVVAGDTEQRGLADICCCSRRANTARAKFRLEWSPPLTQLNFSNSLSLVE